MVKCNYDQSDKSEVYGGKNVQQRKTIYTNAFWSRTIFRALSEPSEYHQRDVIHWNGYEEDVTQKVCDFIKQKLPENLFSTVQECLQNIYADIDDEDNLKEKVGLCNQCLENTDYLLRLDFDDTYYVGVYFLSVVSLW